MHYFIFAQKDSYITEDSPGHIISYPDSTNRNYGADEILELKKEFVNSYSTASYNVSRILTEFDYSDISSSIVDGDITSPKFYLRYYEVEGQSELDKTYSLSSFPLSQSWEEGVGKHFDNPKTTGGVTWESGSSGVWLGSEIFADPSFDIDSEWPVVGDDPEDETLDANTTNTGKLTAINAQDCRIQIGGILTVGTKYQFQIVIDSFTDGRIRGESGMASMGHIEPTGPETFTREFVATGTGFDINIDVSADFTATEASLKEVFGGGYWISSGACSQSFANQSGDMEMDVTNIVDSHLDGTNPNYGFITKFSGSYEDDATPLNLKFFSKNTHTIYAPKLEVRWNNISFSTGSLNSLTMSGEVDNHIFIKGLQPSYRESEKVRFRMGCRKKYVQKTFTESVLTSSFYIPEGSSSYSIVDIATDTSIIPFSAYTSMYFNLNKIL